MAAASEHPHDLHGDKMFGRALRRGEARKRYLAPSGLLRAANTALLLEVKAAPKFVEIKGRARDFTSDPT